MARVPHSSSAAADDWSALVADRARRVDSSTIRDLLAVVGADHILSLAGGLPPDGMLPVPEVEAAVRSTLAAGPAALQYGATEGAPALRGWIAANELDGADPARVVVTHGSQQALRLLVEALVEPGDVVVVERTSYVGMLQALSTTGAVLVDVEGDAEGMCTDRFEALLSAGCRPKLVYLAPTFQNPTGTVLPVERRRNLGALAARYGFVVIDDDPYRELGFEPAPARLRDVVPDALAVTLGSFSKTIAPGLRVGWVHGPAWLVDVLIRLKQASDLHTGTLGQQIVWSLVSRADWLDEHLAGLRVLYRHRAQVAIDAFERHFGDAANLATPRGGMFLWVGFPQLGADTDELLKVGLQEGVAVVPGSAFDPHGRASQYARVCAVTLENCELDIAVARLARAAERLGRNHVAGVSA
ncbi:PLP-dependent aminotransferase family protein [soil metagenome]